MEAQVNSDRSQSRASRRPRRKRPRALGLGSLLFRSLASNLPNHSLAESYHSHPPRAPRQDRWDPSTFWNDESTAAAFDWQSDSEFTEERILSALELGRHEDENDNDSNSHSERSFEGGSTTAAEDFTPEDESWEDSVRTSRALSTIREALQIACTLPISRPRTAAAPSAHVVSPPLTRKQYQKQHVQLHQESSMSPLQYVSQPETDRVPQAHLEAMPVPHKQTTPQMAETTTPGISSSSAATSLTTTPWVRRFLATCHRDVLLPVPKDYCLDNFNLAQLAPVVEHVGVTAMTASSDVPAFSSTTAAAAKPFPIYRAALQLIVQDDPSLTEDTIPEYLQRAATALYLLIHQRYVLSPRGLDMVRRRFLVKPTQVDPIFGQCPRRGCCGMPLLPFGDSDNLQSWTESTATTTVTTTNATIQQDGDSSHLPKHQPHTNSMDDVAFESHAKRYCASCGEVFYHWDSKVDGCAWGSSFCHLFHMVFGREVFGPFWTRIAKQHQLPSLQVEPRIFGFRLHPSTRMGHSSSGQ
jgi:hypothetical protein